VVVGSIPAQLELHHKVVANNRACVSVCG